MYMEYRRRSAIVEGVGFARGETGKTEDQKRETVYYNYRRSKQGTEKKRSKEDVINGALVLCCKVSPSAARPRRKSWPTAIT
jgi:hypothetical protein